MTEATDTAPADPGALYRTIWRWHFYAGLLCLPFFILLATTGGLYLFRDQLEPVLEKKLLVVDASAAGQALTPEALIARALSAQPGLAVRFTPPPAPDRSVEVGVRDADGRIVGVFLTPDGRLLGRIADDDRPMKLISRIHSLDILGKAPNLIIEVVAGWAILLVLSGVFLWWPRGRRGGVVTVRATPARRVWWRDLHAVTGIFACVIIVFLAVTGMPWSGFWGENFRRIANASGLGMPAQVKATAVASDAALAAVAPGSWTLDPSAVPSIAPSGAAPLALTRVVAIAERAGMAPGYVVRLPASAGGVYTLQSYPNQATGQRVIHLDQYSGRVLADVGFKDYGPVSKATEWGIAVHTGGQYGWINQLVMLAGCLSIIGLSVSAAVMWWKRRPAGRLGAPPAPPRKRSISAFALLAVAIGLLFPLLGASILLALLIDRLAPTAFKVKHAL